MTVRTRHRAPTRLAATALAIGLGLLAVSAPVSAALPARIRPTTTTVPGTPGAGPGVPAPAATPTTCSATVLATAKARTSRALADRVVKLTALSRQVQSSPWLTAAHRSTLAATLAAQLAGIQGLQAKVPTDADCATVGADAKTMVDAYRVYVVTGPQVHLTAGADAEAGIAAKLQALEPRIDAAIVAAQAAGKDVTAARQAQADLVAQVTAAQQGTAGVAPDALAATPASYPGCWQGFLADGTALQKGSTALHQAGADLKAILKSL